jgi:hypothetical protein
MNDQTFEILQKIRSHLWDAEYEMSLHRDDLNFMDSEDLRYLKRLLRVTATQITDHIHTENGWDNLIVDRLRDGPLRRRNRMGDR